MKLNMIYLTNTYDSEFTLIDDDSYHWVKTGELSDSEKMKRKVIASYDNLTRIVGQIPGTSREESIENLWNEIQECDDEASRASLVPGEIVNNELLSFQDIKEMMHAVRKYSIQIVEVHEDFII